MTPTLEHAANRSRPRAFTRRLPFARWRAGVPFGWVLAASGLLHAAALGALVLAPWPEPVARLTVYTVRVVEAPAAAARARVPAGPALAPAPVPVTRSPASAAEAAAGAPAEARPSPPRRNPTHPVARSAPSADPGPAEAQAEAIRPSALPRNADAAFPGPTDSRNSARAATAVTAAVVLPGGLLPAGAPGEGALPTVAAEALDAGFALAAAVSLDYPESARRARKAGHVRLEVEVGPDGRVLAVRVLEATPGWGFEEAAAGAYGQARFSPPRWQGRPVRVLWRKTLLFEP